MSDCMTNSLSLNPQTSSNEVIITSTSSITLESPKLGGRQRYFIWSFFNDMGPAKTVGHRKAQCKYCLSCFNFAKLNVMYSHIAHQCDEIITCNPNARKEILTRMHDFEQQSPPGRVRKRSQYETGSADQLHSKQYTMDRFTSRIISYSEQQNMDRSLLRAVIMNGMSFRIVNNEFFIEFVKKLNPSYDPPNRKKLANGILMQELVYVENKNESLLSEAAHLTLNIDGWSDQCHRSLYEYNVITDSRKAIVLSLIDVSSFNHTANFLVNRLESVLARTSTNINITSKIRAVVTDNPKAMEKMREMFISKPGHQHILELRCFAHAINLIAGDIVKHVYANNVLNKVAVITSFCNQSHMFKSKLKEEAERLKIRTQTLHTIVKTRWTSVAECLNSFILLRPPLEVLVAIDKSIAPTKVINIINNRLFFHDIENLYKIMQPLAYAMKIIQSCTDTLADCYLILSYLRLITDKFIINTDTRTFGKFVGKVVNTRLIEFQNDLYLSAYYLHPKYRGAGMLTTGRSAVYRYIAEYSKKIGNNITTTKNVIGALQRYEIKSGPYALRFTQDDTPASWWTMINDNTHKNSLSNISLRIFSITPHAVMPERLFSILDWHHTKRRNRLNPFTLEAIAKIHTFYKNGSNSVDGVVDACHLEDILDLMDDSNSTADIADNASNSIDATDFIQIINDNHHALRAKCDAEDINEEQSVDNEDIPEGDDIINTQDRGYQQILMDIGFIDANQSLSPEYDVTIGNDLVENGPNEDYDVEELLTASMAI